MTKLILLDRDGVLNQHREDFVKTPEELVMIEGATEAVALLKQAGYSIAVVTNQSCVERGIITESTLDDIHDLLQSYCKQAGGSIDRFYIAPDAPWNATERRKPGAAMLKEAMEYFDTTPENTYMIGDSLIDIEAGQNAACHTFFVKTGKDRDATDSLPADIICDTLLAAAHKIIADT